MDEKHRPAASPQVHCPFAIIAITSNSRTSLSHLVRSSDRADADAAIAGCSFRTSWVAADRLGVVGAVLVEMRGGHVTRRSQARARLGLRP